VLFPVELWSMDWCPRIFRQDKNFKFILFLFALQKERKKKLQIWKQDEIAAKYLFINVLFYNDYLFKL
jgi:hypothetical protein